MSVDFQHYPLIAILRGITPKDAVSTAEQLVFNGITQLEVPLNSPQALKSIALMIDALPENIVIGGGTVLQEDQVQALHDIGAKLVVSPNMNPAVIALTQRLGMLSAPGVATPTEAFAALEAGASMLKAFPAEQIAPATIKAWRAVLPGSADIVAVGGIDESTMNNYWYAGVTGFGLGSSLYKPGQSAAMTGFRAASLVAAWQQTVDDLKRERSAGGG